MEHDELIPLGTEQEAEAVGHPSFDGCLTEDWDSPLVAQHRQWLKSIRHDTGTAAPYMESSTAWSELLEDCDAGKVNLIITQKVSNVSREIQEVIICARILAARNPPVGIYFISENLYTLASYYREDLRDSCFFPTPDWKILPDDESDIRGALHDRSD